MSDNVEGAVAVLGTVIFNWSSAPKLISERFPITLCSNLSAGKTPPPINLIEEDVPSF